MDFVPVMTNSREQCPATTRRIAHGDRGATLVEAALALPVLFLVIFGILEYGLAFSSYHAVSNAARDSGRQATISGDNTGADFNILQAIGVGLSAVNESDIERIVVFKASGPGDTVPASCAAGIAVVGVCNVYTADHLSWELDQFGCDPASNPVRDPDRFWCPRDRKVAVIDPPDYVGVYIAVRHDFTTGLFGDGMNFEDTVVSRMEASRR